MFLAKYHTFITHFREAFNRRPGKSRIIKKKSRAKQNSFRRNDFYQQWKLGSAYGRYNENHRLMTYEGFSEKKGRKNGGKGLLQPSLNSMRYCTFSVPRFRCTKITICSYKLGQLVNNLNDSFHVPVINVYAL